MLFLNRKQIQSNIMGVQCIILVRYYQQYSNQVCLMSDQLVGIRTYYPIKTADQARHLFTSQIQQRIRRQEQRIFFKEELGASTHLSLVINARPLYLLRVKKRISKSGKVKQIVKQVKNIKRMYVVRQLPDFVSTAMSQSLYKKQAINIKSQDVLNFLKNKLHQKITNSIANIPVLDELEFQTRPHSYLRDYSLVPPNYDLFSNNVKAKETFQFNSCCIKFEDEAPNQCPYEIPRQVSESNVYSVLKEYLSKRPCWLKNVMLYTLRQNNHEFRFNEVKQAIKYLCYNYKSGPWKYTFCSYGFNPVQNEKAVMYQTVGLKLKDKDIDSFEQDAPIQDTLYDPSFKNIAKKCMGFYQLCDVAVESVQEVLRGKLIKSTVVCSKKYGWLSKNQHIKIMRSMRVSIKK